MLPPHMMQHSPDHATCLSSSRIPIQQTFAPHDIGPEHRLTKDASLHHQITPSLSQNLLSLFRPPALTATPGHTYTPINLPFLLQPNFIHHLRYNLCQTSKTASLPLTLISTPFANYSSSNHVFYPQRPCGCSV
jgi:hypothetical protein